MQRACERQSGEPDVWFFVFCEKTPSVPGHWYALGRFRHVWAFAYVGGAWLIYDLADRRTGLRVLPDTPATLAEIADLREGETTLCLAPRARSMPLRIGFYCVPAMAHLAGVGRCAVLPDGFYRDLLRAGAEVVGGGNSGTVGEAGSAG
jgi:hypothetical protein